MKRLFKKVLYVFIGLLAFVFLYFGIDAVLSRIPTYKATKDLTKHPLYDVYILSNGIHTDLVFPTTSALIDWRNIFSPSK